MSADAPSPDLPIPDLPTPAELLPHRPPFLLLDELVELTPGERAVGRWTLTGEEYFFAGHFPGRPTLPGVLMIESLAQLGACGALSQPDFAGMLPLFGGVDKAKFRRQVVPGEVLDLEITFGRFGRRGGKASGRATVDGELACQAELMVVMVEA